MPFITLTGVSWVTPQSRCLFENLKLGFDQKRIGLVGRNGVGKSTLLKLITGEYQPQAGSVSVSGKLGVVKQLVQIQPEQTVADLFDAGPAFDILRLVQAGQATMDEMAAADWTLEDRIASVLREVGLDARPTTKLMELSGGQRTRACLAAAIFASPDFLLLDEPTNNLDSLGRQAVVQLLSNWRSGAIVASHDRQLLEHMDAIVELTTLGATRYGGNWSHYQQQKALELEAARQDLAHAQKQASQIQQKSQQTLERKQRRDSTGAKKAARGDMPRIILGMRKNKAELTTGKNARLADRLKTQAAQAAEDARSRIEVLEELSISLPTTGLAQGRNVLTLQNVTAGYDPGHPLINDLSLVITGPQRVAIMGNNGSGKTSLIRLIQNQLTPYRGEVSVNVPWAVLDQSVSVLNPDLSILENFKELNPGSNENACHRTLASFQFKAVAAHQTAGTLSGGEMLRAALACTLGGQKPPSLLILDEPTNHLDIYSIQAVEKGLQAYDGALIIVSHDETFLKNLNITKRVELLPRAD